jgi:hypothetical protein
MMKPYNLVEYYTDAAGRAPAPKDMRAARVAEVVVDREHNVQWPEVDRLLEFDMWYPYVIDPPWKAVLELLRCSH